MNLTGLKRFFDSVLESATSIGNKKTFLGITFVTTSRTVSPIFIIHITKIQIAAFKAFAFRWSLAWTLMDIFQEISYWVSVIENIQVLSKSYRSHSSYQAYLGIWTIDPVSGSLAQDCCKTPRQDQQDHILHCKMPRRRPKQLIKYSSESFLTKPEMLQKILLDC